MKRIAFSVWPGDPGNIPKPEVIKINERTKKVLSDFEFVVVDDFKPFDKASNFLFESFHSPKTVKDYTNWSDYIRVYKIIEFLQAGYDEVLYVDYDLLLFEAPTKFGCAIEGHFEGPNRELMATDKFWFRGVNCTYYVNKSHLEIMRAHFLTIQTYIFGCYGQVKHCYPMNHMSHIEEGIGYVDGFYLFGSMDDPGFCTYDKSILFVEFVADILEDQTYRNIKAVNMMGSKKNSQEGNISVYEDMRRQLLSTTSSQTDIDMIKNVIRNTTKPLRVNYGSHKMRSKLKSYLDDDKVFTLFD